MAIWPANVPNPNASRWEVAQVALPKELFLNPGKKAHREDVDVVGKSDLRASTSLYDDEGNSYPIDDAGQLYVPLDFGQTIAESTEVEIEKGTKN